MEPNKTLPKTLSRNLPHTPFKFAMPRKKSFLTCTDQFCGAGGSSIGATKAGVEVVLAMNHWKRAIETHQTNFPNTDHDCADISASDPRRYVSTDILITSPECTNHSLAKGLKIAKTQLQLYAKGILDPAAERSRATMWDVPRFAEYHSYNIIIVENVVDARKWVMFDSWLHAMYSLGYKHECVYLNSMFCWPTPQSRDRMYVVFWKKGNKKPNLDFNPPAYCTECSGDVNAIQWWKNPEKAFGKYKTQYLYKCPKHNIEVKPYYYAAFNCIDWSNPGKRIGDRKKDLAPKSKVRIQWGIDKFGDQLINPFLVNDQQSTGIGHRVRSAMDGLSTIPTQPHFKVVMPQIIDSLYTHAAHKGKVVPAVSKLNTQTTRQSNGLLIPMPFIIKAEHAQHKNVRAATDPLPTQTKCDSMGFVVPQIVSNYSPGFTKPVTEAVNTLTANDHHGLLTLPFIVENKGTSKARKITEPIGAFTSVGFHGLITNESWNSFVTCYYGGSHVARPVFDALPTLPTVERVSLVNFQKPNYEDCYYRMLQPHEVQAGMAFDETYIVTGDGKEKVKQLGNAVTPPAMTFLVQRCVESLR